MGNENESLQAVLLPGKPEVLKDIMFPNLDGVQLILVNFVKCLGVKKD